MADDSITEIAKQICDGVTALDAGVTALEGRAERLEAKLGGLEAKLGRIERKVTGLRELAHQLWPGSVRRTNSDTRPPRS